MLCYRFNMKLLFFVFFVFFFITIYFVLLFLCVISVHRYSCIFFVKLSDKFILVLCDRVNICIRILNSTRVLCE